MPSILHTYYKALLLLGNSRKRITPFHFPSVFSFLLVVAISGCSEDNKPARNVPLDEIAGNETVKTYMEAFEGRGVQKDDSKLTPPDQALQNFKMADDLELDLVLAEPQIHQPVEVER